MPFDSMARQIAPARGQFTSMVTQFSHNGTVLVNFLVCPFLARLNVRAYWATVETLIRARIQESPNFNSCWEAISISRFTDHVVSVEHANDKARRAWEDALWQWLG